MVPFLCASLLVVEAFVAFSIGEGARAVLQGYGCLDAYACPLAVAGELNKLHKLHDSASKPDAVDFAPCDGALQKGFRVGPLDVCAVESIFRGSQSPSALL